MSRENELVELFPDFTLCVSQVVSTFSAKLYSRSLQVHGVQY